MKKSWKVLENPDLIIGENFKKITTTEDKKNYSLKYQLYLKVNFSKLDIWSNKMIFTFYIYIITILSKKC